MTPTAARAALLVSLTGGLIPPEHAPWPAPFQEALVAARPLRDYQHEMLREALRYIRLGVRRILLQLPTGGGKTVMAAAMLGAAAEIGFTSDFTVHRKELIDQASRTFAAASILHGFIAAGRPADLSPAVTLAGVQTLANRLDSLLPPDLAVIDEAHHATAATWERVLAFYGDAVVIGLTATPERLDGKGLERHFDVMIQGPPVAELIDRGFLSPFDYYAPGIPDLSGIATVAGDYDRGAIGEIMDRPQIIGDVVEHYRRLAPGQQGIVFAVSREHSRNLAEAFAAAGVRAAHVDGAMRERSAVVDRFRAGELEIMTNVDLFGEGFDVPGLVYCGLARPTKSLSLHLQQVGRALRVIDRQKTAIICDHAGNAFTHGLPDDEREWSLKGRAGRARGGVDSDAVPVRQCLVCFRVSPSTMRSCPGCATDFPAVERKLLTKEGTLTKIEREDLKRKAAQRRAIEERGCSSYVEFKELAERRGYKNPRGWAKVKVGLRNRSRIR